MLHVVRSNHDVRFLASSTHEISYVLEYVVKNQNEIDNIAALTLSLCTKNLRKEKEFKNERTKTQLLYGRIAFIAYGRSNRNEVGAMAGFCCLLNGTPFLSSHDFQTLPLGRYLQDLNEEESYRSILKKTESYV